MIAKLKGNVNEVMPESVVIMVNGVGYDVELVGCGVKEGDDVELYMYTHVREQELRLFGFSSRQELVFFKMLLQVSGVGPKLAQTLMNQMQYIDIVQAIISNEPQAIKVKGVGKKTAQRLILELNSKLSKMTEYTQIKSVEVNNNLDQSVMQEAIVALEALGFSNKEIEGLLVTIDANSAQNIESIIKYALHRNINKQ